jgi:hypothetical protein
MNNRTFILNKEDVNNPLHPYLWQSICETFGIDREATEVCFKRSELDYNVVVEDIENCKKYRE